MHDTSDRPGEDDRRPPAEAEPSDLSLDQLSEAFATLLRTEDDPRPPRTPSAGGDPVGGRGEGVEAADARYAISPLNILEAMLFVGRPDSQPLARETLAGVMRDVEPAEIDQLVERLNDRYDAVGTPYRVVSRGAGYQLQLRDCFQPVRERFYGRARQARLSQAAIEVLAIVAYRQPVTAETVRQLRGTPSGGILSQLVRRQLIALTRSAEDPRQYHYETTERFLRLFGLSSPQDLPPCEAARREL